MHTFHKLLTPIGTSYSWFVIFIQNFSQVIRQKNLSRKNLGLIFTLIISIAMLRSCTYDTQYFVCYVIVSLRQFDSKGDYYYVLCRFGRIVLWRTNDQITFRYIFPIAELSEMRMLYTVNQSHINRTIIFKEKKFWKTSAILLKKVDCYS